MAQMAIKRGDPAAALKSYASAREYSSSPNHHLEQGLGILEVSSLSLATGSVKLIKRHA